ncbi:PREDICTED: patellin-4-like [Tarenaya hassleriana]|uniref:patellin-4-like n=1 Tax=Tarenaya hassleriana TaxID=28532 RepID=UPI00053C8BF4|nr:PREDICTED: patellin-4-like [Tarenaya hassleriana]
MTAEVKVEEKQVETEVVVAPQEETEKVVEETVKALEEDVKETVEKETLQEEKKPESVEKSASFKEESNFFSDLKESERKALSDLKSKLEDAIVGNTLFKKKENPVKEKKEESKKEAEEEKKVEEKVEEEKKAEEKTEEEKKEDVVAEEEKKSEALVTEEAPKKEVKVEAEEEKKKTEAIVTEDAPKEEVKPEAEEEKKTEDVVVGEEEKAGAAEEKKTEAIVTEETPKEEVKAETEKEKKKVEDEEEEEEETVDQDISLWGVPLLPGKGGDATDVILLKFLRARDFKVNEAFEMLKKTLLWRKKHNIDSILEEDFGEELKSAAAYMNGVDLEGRPVCYNVYGVFDNEELYKKTFGTEENREKFLRWRFQLMEKGIQKLDLKPGGVTSLLQIHDLKNSPGLTKKEIRVSIKHAIEALQDNYPELVSRNIFINVPFWFYALNALLSPFLTQRTKSKFLVCRPAKVTETLLKYIPAEEIPVQYGGFKRDDDLEFSGEHASGTISEVIVKPGSSETIEIHAPEVGATLVWDIAVLGWEVNYKEEFVPADEGSYTVIVQKGKKIGSNEGPTRNSFRNNEPGKIVLSVDNASGKKKRVLYRYKTKIGSSF